MGEYNGGGYEVSRGVERNREGWKRKRKRIRVAGGERRKSGGVPLDETCSPALSSPSSLPEHGDECKANKEGGGE